MFVKSKIKKIITIFLIVCILFPKNIYAITQQSAGDTLAQFAINFERDYAEETRYSLDGWDKYQTGDRAMAYKGIRQYKGANNYYGMDCVGWVGCAIHWSLKLGTNDTFTSFVVPEGDDGQSFSASNGFVEIDKNSTLQNGDILCFWNHVGIYAIDPNTQEEVVIHCDGHGRNGAGVNRSNLAQYKSTHSIYHVARISDTTANTIDANNVTVIFNQITGAASGLDDYGLYYGTTTGRYTGSYTFGDWLFSKISGFFDYLLGILTYAIKVPILGYTSIVERTINKFLQDVSGPDIQATTNTQVEEEEKLYRPKATDTWDRVTIEDLIYNRIPLLDVNLFSFTEAAGQEISEDSIMYTIRMNIAKWYEIIRKISLIFLLFVLIYLGIQIAINTAAGKRAKYKSMLVAWVTSFIVIFCIHYYMILVININQFFVETFEQANINAVQEIEGTEDGSATIYDTIRTKAYAVKMSEGWAGTIMYMVLVYYLIKFLYIYFKRYIAVNILAIMGPAMAVKYAIDKIKSGKGSSLTSWMFDFFINVFLQTIHAVVYTVFMIMAFEIATESIAGFVLALVMLNFLLKAEKILVSIFKFEGKGATFAETREDKNYLKEGFQTGVSAFLFAKGTTKVLFGGGRFLIGTGFGLVQDATNLTGRTINFIGNRKKPEDERKEYEHIDLKEKLQSVGYKIGDFVYEKGVPLPKGKRYRSIRLGMHKYKETDPKLYEAMKKSLKESDKRIIKQWTRTIKHGTKTITSMAKVAVSVPMLVVDTSAGILVLSNGVSNLNKLSRRPGRYGYSSKREKLMKAGAVTATIASAGTFKVVQGMMNETERVKKDAKKNREGREKLDLLVDIARTEDDIDKDMEEINRIINSKKEVEKKGKSDEDKEKIDKSYEKELQQEVNKATRAVISSSTISSVVEDYMFENDLTKLTEKDIENIMQILKNMSISGDIKVEFGSEVKANVKAEIKEQFKKKKKKGTEIATDKKKTVNIIEDAMLREGSIQMEETKKTSGKTSKEDERLTQKYQELSQKIRRLATLTEKAKNVSGSFPTSTTAFVKGSRERSKTKNGKK